MITYEFICYFYIFIIVNFLFIMLLDGEWRNLKALARMGCLVSLMMITMICFFPFPFQTELIEDITAESEGIMNNFIPFRTIIEAGKEAVTCHMYGVFIRQIIGNVLLFTPWGLFLSFYLNEKHRLFKVVAASLMLTISIELFQGVFNILLEYNYRSVDIDDVILNVTGGIVGYYGYCIILHLYRKIMGNKKEMKNV